jgi:hypothetical protein
LGVGAQKSGTTWLSHNLRQHPEIWVPEIKEVHYFDDRIKDPANPVVRLRRKLFGKETLDRRWRRFARTQAARHLEGFSWRELSWDLKYFLGTPGDGWYASLFEAGGGRVVGEITPAYSTLGPEAVSRVHGLMPEARIVFMMRSPVERAWSQATGRFHRSNRRGDDESTRQAKLRRHFDTERSRLRTGYLRTLETWASFYPEERIFVGFLEDVRFFPDRLLRSLYEFVNVDPSFKPPGMDQRVHVRSVGRVPSEPIVYLAQEYREEIAGLAERFGGHASFWHFCAEQLIEDPPEESIAYPLWDSGMWEEWVGGAGPGPDARPGYGSGTLASFRAARPGP